MKALSRTVFFPVLLAACLVWAGKAALLFADQTSAQTFGFMLVTLSAVSVLGTCFFLGKSVNALAGANKEIKKTLQASLVVSLFFSALQVLPLAPDTFEVARLENPAFAFWALLAAWAFVVLTSVFLRFPFVLLCGLGQRLRNPVVKLLIFASAGFMVMALESLQLRIFPPHYLAALPVPILLPPAATRGTPTEERTGPVIVLVNPRISNEHRLMVSENPAELLSREAQSLVEKWVQVPGFQGFTDVVFVFPETTYFLDGRLLGDFHTEIVNLLRDKTPDIRVRVILGAQYSSANIIFYADVNPLTGSPLRGVLAAKSGLVPLFETDVMGFSLRKNETLAEVREDEFLEGEWLEGLPALLTPRFFAICYEGLFPSRWTKGEPRVIFTNHWQFKAFGLASRLYDQTLRRLAWFYDSPLLLVGNHGTTGYFSNENARKDVSSVNRDLPEESPVVWTLEMEREETKDRR